MSTRRGLLTAMGFGAIAGLTGACAPQPRQAPPGTRKEGDKLLISHDSGLGVFDTGLREWLVRPAPGAATDRHLATMESGRLIVRQRSTLRIDSETPLNGDWTVATTSGDNVALIAGRNPAKPRPSTKLLVVRPGIDQRTYDLPGTIEPEAFSNDGAQLFVLDHQSSGETYRVRSLSLNERVLSPLSDREKKRLPLIGEEVMRGEGRHAVYDRNRGILFSLYTHGGDHRHSGQLLGVRPDAPGIHAFIHALSLRDGWANCIDLPKPFGDGPAASHTIALGPNAVYAIAAAHGVIAEVDPVELKIRANSPIKAHPGEAYAIFTDQLLIAAGNTLSGRDVGFGIRGLAKGSRLWAGRDGAVAAIEDGKVTETVQVPGLICLR